MRNFVPARVAEICGVGGAAIVAGLVVWLEERMGWSLLGPMLWGFLPLGAIVAGLLAATGYAVGILWMRVRMTRQLRAQIIFVMALTFFFTHWLVYQRIRVDGVPLPELIGFRRYLDIVFSSSQFFLRGMSVSGPLGVLGYVVAALQLGGFCAGGALVASRLGKGAFCPGCDRAFGEPAKQHGRRWLDSDRFWDFSARLKAHDAVDASYLALLVPDGPVGTTAGARNGMGWEHQFCQSCGDEWVVETPRWRGEEDWVDVAAQRRVLSVVPGADVATALEHAEQVAYSGDGRPSAPAR